MNNRLSKMLRGMAGYISGQAVPYMITPGSIKQKSFVTGYVTGPDGKQIEQLGHYKTATFAMEDCPRKMAKILKKINKRVRTGAPASSKPKKGGYGSRRGKQVATSSARTQCPKPERNHIKLTHGLGLYPITEGFAKAY